MELNKYTVQRIDTDYTTVRCNRAKLDTGTFCNYDCEFCYYQGLLHLKTDFDTIKKRIDKIYSYGIDEIDLSGGESSVHKDWFKILQYCSTKFKNISTLSNGWAFARKDFMEKSKESGLTEILFSVHGYDEQSHNEIVRRNGAWKRMLQAIENAHELGIKVRVNCTVYQKNCDGMVGYDKIIKKINPVEVNFLTLNYWTNNKHAEPIDYKLVTDNIKTCIDKIKHLDTIINVRYTPYCYMQGYEKYVCNQFQHIYDIYDWNLEIYDLELDTSVEYTTKEKIDLAHATASERRIRDYKKHVKCFGCKYLYICDGVEKQVKSFDFKPVSGKKIRNVNHYRKDHYEV